MPKRHDPPERINDGNDAMWDAWNRGNDILDELGDRADYGAMKARAGGDDSEAEKMRKHRAMARRITNKELDEICELTHLHRKAWGPTHLVALSRLTRIRDRRRIAKTALEEGWGLAELQRRVRRQLGPMKDATKVGRKRELDLADEAEILDEIQRLSLSWIRLAAQLQQDDVIPGEKLGLELLPQNLRNQFVEATELVAKLQKRIEKQVKTQTH